MVTEARKAAAAGVVPAKAEYVVVTDEGPRLIVGKDEKTGKAIRKTSKKGDIVMVSPGQAEAFKHQLKPRAVAEAELTALQEAAKAEKAAVDAKEAAAKEARAKVAQEALAAEQAKAAAGQ